MNSYRHIFIPNDITVKFLEIAQKNTGKSFGQNDMNLLCSSCLARNIETCGILTGVRVNFCFLKIRIVEYVH